MKKYFSVLLVGILSLSMLTSCKKASDGGSLLALMGLGGGAATQFIKQYGTDFTHGGELPLSKDYDVKAQFLYTAAEIGGSGLIRNIRLHLYNGTGGNVTWPDVTIKMGHTDLSTLTTTFATNVETGQGSEITVLGNKTLSIPGSTDGNSHWYDIPLDTPFNYNGVDNLVVDFEVPTKCSGEVAPYIATSTGRVAYSIVTDTQTGVAEYSTSTGAVTDSLVLMQFVFAGGDDRISHTGTGAPVPFSASAIRTQMLFTSEEINGSGKITGIGFALATAASAESSFTVTVQMAHATRDALENTTWNANFDSGDPVTVANAESFVVANSAAYASYVWLPLSGSFNYNGQDNLIVDIDMVSPSTSLTLMCDTAGTSTRLWGSSAAPTTLTNHRYSVKFRFAGGTMDLITANAFDDQVAPFYDSLGGYQIQTLYRSSELGLNGSITGMSLRLYYPSIAGTYSDFRIIIGQTDAATLTYPTDFAANMENETTVYSGTLAIPAGLVAGDWIDIPFSSEFICDPQKNLVVHYITGSGNEFNETCFYNSSTIYNDRYITRDNSTFPSGNNGGDGVHAVRFTLR